MIVGERVSEVKVSGRILKLGVEVVRCKGVAAAVDRIVERVLVRVQTEAVRIRRKGIGVDIVAVGRRRRRRQKVVEDVVVDRRLATMT